MPEPPPAAERPLRRAAESRAASPAPPPGSLGRSAGAVRIVRRVLPWVVAVAILGWLFARIPAAEAVAEVRQADLGTLLPTALISLAGWFLLDSAALSYLFTRFHAPLPWREARSLRALTYLLAIVNWNLGTGGIVLHMRSSRGVRVLDSMSTLFFYGMIDGTLLASLCLLGALGLGLDDPGLATIAAVAGAFLVAQVGTLLFYASRGVPRYGFLARLKRARLFRTHRLASGRDFALLFAIRLLYFAGFILFFWLGLSAVGAAAPLGHVAATVPAILLSGGIPITPAGLGTQQAAILYFYAGYGSEVALLGFGLLFPVILHAGRALLAVFYLGDLRSLLTTIRTQPGADDPDDAADASRGDTADARAPAGAVAAPAAVGEAGATAAACRSFPGSVTSLRAMKIEASAATDIGRVRKSNQDSVGCFPEIRLFMVADGMGGLHDGEIASRLAVEQIRGYFTSSPNPEAVADGTRALTAAVLAANQRLLLEGERQGATPQRPILGATVVALRISPETGRAFWAHVGDSRLYRARSGRLELLTADDTLPGAPYRGASPVPLTLPHTNQLVQALGTTADIEPTVGESTIEPGDVFLLCSDGVSGLLAPEVIERELTSASGVDEKAQNLIRLALDASGRDNASVVLVRVT